MPLSQTRFLTQRISRRGWILCAALIGLYFGYLHPAQAQVLSKEYIRLGGRVIAIENSVPTLSSSQITMPSGTGSGSFSLYAPQAVSWNTTDSPVSYDTGSGWLTVTTSGTTLGTPSQSLIGFTLTSANPGTSARTATITVSFPQSSYASLTFRVTQSAGNGSSFSYSPAGPITLTSSGPQTGRIDLTGNITSWTATSSASWLTLSLSSLNGPGNTSVTGTTERVMYYYAVPPTGGAPATISFSTAPSVQTTALQVVPPAGPSCPSASISVDRNSLYFEGTLGTWVAVTSSGPWTASVDQSWVTLKYGYTHSGNTPGETVLIAVQGNADSTTRNATVTVTVDGCPVSRQIAISQAPTSVVLYPPQVDVAFGQDRLFMPYIDGVYAGHQLFTWTVGGAGYGRVAYVPPYDAEDYIAPLSVPDIGKHDQVIAKLNSNFSIQATAEVTFSLSAGTSVIPQGGFSPMAGTGMGAKFIAKFPNPANVGFLARLAFLGSTANSYFYLSFSPSGTGVMMFDGATLAGNGYLNTPGVMQGSGCTINLATSSATFLDKEVDVTLDLQFPDQAAGVLAISYFTFYGQSAIPETALTTYTVVLPPVSVSVAPATKTLYGGQTQQFTATVQHTNNTAVNWAYSPSVGTLESSGSYTAPSMISAQQTVTVTATSLADNTKSASATITLMPVSVSLTPTSATLYASQNRQFTATVTNATNTTVTWTLSPNVGSITTSGLYTAPSTIAAQQTVTVTATSQADNTKTASATITLMPPITVSVSPAGVTLAASQTQQFTATVTNTSNTAVTWSISPVVGTIGTSGLYTAPASITTQQTVTVKATSQADSTKTATATITLSTLPANLVLQNLTLTSSTTVYQAVNTITAGPAVTISNGASVTLKAGSSISLEPGFHATAGTAGTTFDAKIQ
jgi:hypothetical protein